MKLSIEDYAKAEAAAVKKASYPAIRAFSPSYFRSIGFPTDVTDEAELARYVDVMGETGCLDDIFDKQFYTGEEQREILTLAEQVKNLTRQLFGKPIQPIANLFAPWPILRMIEHFQAYQVTPLNVFEVGAGCGYLGAYLINRGYMYTGTDVTQAFYLWQNRLWESLTTGFAERVFAGQSATAEHLPWWFYADIYKGISDTRRNTCADVFVCEAALGEMEPHAARYTLHLASKIIHDSPFGCVIYTNVGEQKNHSQGDLQAIAMIECGLRLRRIGGVTMLLGPKFENHLLEKIDHPPHLGEGPVKCPRDFFNLGDLPDNYAFFRFCGIGNPKPKAKPRLSLFK